jgi:Concanavalin A-like lectin/glucanases superfamily
MNYMLIIIGFIVVVAIYMLYKYFTNTTLTSGVMDLSKRTEYKYDKLKTPTSKIYSLSGWIFMTGQTDNGGGFIFQRAAAAGSANWNFGLKFNGTTLDFYGGTKQQAQFTITNQLPLQKWVYVVINVNGDLVEVYLNGKIVKTVKHNDNTLTTPFSSTASLFVGDSTIKGYITQFSMVPELIGAATVWKNYLNGNGVGNQFLNYFMPYNINMAVTKDDVLQRQFSIF